MKNNRMHKMKTLMLAFWMTIITLFLSYLSPCRNCMLCMPDRIMLTLVSAMCFFARWHDMMRKVAFWMTVVFIVMLTYQLFICAFPQYQFIDFVNSDPLFICIGLVVSSVLLFLIRK